MKKQGQVRIGISGWAYKDWRGGFYPQDLPRRQELSFLAGQFNSLSTAIRQFSTIS